MSKPLEIDDRRVARAMDAVDEHEKVCHIKDVRRCVVCTRLYEEAARCVNLAGENARGQEA